jgi:hypothetical protein
VLAAQAPAAYCVLAVTRLAPLDAPGPRLAAAAHGVAGAAFFALGSIARASACVPSLPQLSLTHALAPCTTAASAARR